jgi:hypothetical protein
MSFVFVLSSLTGYRGQVHTYAVTVTSPRGCGLRNMSSGDFVIVWASNSVLVFLYKLKWLLANPILGAVVLTGGWTRGLAFVRQFCYLVSHTPFCLGYFGDRVSHVCPSWPGLPSSYSCFPCSWGDRCMSLGLDFIGWDEILQTLCLGWPLNSILQISTSCVAGITGMYHHAWPRNPILRKCCCVCGLPWAWLWQTHSFLCTAEFVRAGQSVSHVFGLLGLCLCFQVWGHICSHSSSTWHRVQKWLGKWL